MSTGRCVRACGCRSTIPARSSPRPRPLPTARSRMRSSSRSCRASGCAAKTTLRPGMRPSTRPSTAWARRSTSSGTRTAATVSTAPAERCWRRVHYGRDYDNAFWNGERMVFGDGDGEVFHGLHRLADRHRARTLARRHRRRGRAALPRPVRRPQRVDRRRLRRAHRAASHGPDGRRGVVAHRRGHLHRCRAGHGTALPGSPRHRLRRRCPRARSRNPRTWTTTSDTRRQRRRAHQLRHPESRVLPASRRRSAGRAWERAGLIWYRTLTAGTLSSAADFTVFAQATLAAATRGVR